MKKPGEEGLIVKKLLEKSTIKQTVYRNIYNVFQDLKQVTEELANEIQESLPKNLKNIPIEFKDKGDFSCELRFAGDILIINMHTNVFELPRNHEIKQTSYVKADPTRSFCGIIQVYNFLSDSFKYNRLDDVGYLVARIFVNKEFHYFVEGKRQVGFMFNNFINAQIDKEALKQIISTAILYCIDFDLLTPPYDNVKEVSVQEMQLSTCILKLRTGKRLGFRFQADHDEK